MYFTSNCVSSQLSCQILIYRYKYSLGVLTLLIVERKTLWNELKLAFIDLTRTVWKQGKNVFCTFYKSAKVWIYITGTIGLDLKPKIRPLSKSNEVLHSTSKQNVVTSWNYQSVMRRKIAWKVCFKSQKIVSTHTFKKVQRGILLNNNSKTWWFIEVIFLYHLS